MTKQKLIEDISEVDHKEMNLTSWDKEQGVLISGNDAQRLLNMWDALELLVEARLIKDYQGETVEYKQLKEKGWSLAKECFNINEILEKHISKLKTDMAKASDMIDRIKNYMDEQPDRKA